MVSYKIQIASTPEELAAAMQIRRQVFIEEQHVPESREQDGKDNESKHVIVTADNKPIGTARIRVIENNKITKIKIERMAVIKEYRSKGIGKQIIQFIETYAKSTKAKELIAHSQWQAISFYKNSGYKERGEPFYDAGIGHIEMFKRIDI